MALFGKKDPAEKPVRAKKAPVAKESAPKRSARKPAPTKRGKKVASISDVNAATSSTEEPQLLATKAPAPEPLTGDRVSAYGGFSSNIYSEEASKSREKSVSHPDEFEVAHEAGVIYVNENGREFYFDEYGKQQFADEVPPSPEIPESFEEARNSSSRERFQREAEAVRTQVAQLPSAPTGAPISDYPAPSGFPVTQYDAQSYDGVPAHPADGGGYVDQTPPPAGYAPRHSDYNPINHGAGAEVVNLRDAPHIENPFAAGAAHINEQIDRGVIAENFPAMATTIASLSKSSKTPNEISEILLGYIRTTVDGEGVDGALKLLGNDNIYAPLLISAVMKNMEQIGIEPSAIRDVWKLEPEVRIEKEIVYVKDSSASSENGKGFWISLEDVADSAPIFERLTNESEKEKSSSQLNYAQLDY